MQWGDIADGQGPYRIIEDAQLDISVYCSSGYALNTGDGDNPIWYCMPPEQVVGHVYGRGIRFDLEPQVCNTTKFLDHTDVTKGTPSTVEAFCGYNQVNNRFCPTLKSDKVFVDTWKDVTSALLNAEAQKACHTNTLGFFEQQGCAALSTYDNDLAYRWKQAQWLVNDPRGLAIVADNEDCVKETITAGYWQRLSGIYLSPILVLLLTALQMA